jgi:hypothetical protein
MKPLVILTAVIAAATLAIGIASADTITGCLKGKNAEGVYELTNTGQKGEIEVGGSSDLAEHVGHTVKLTGDWVKSGADIGEKEAGKEDKNERHFKVSSVQHIKAGCSQ